MRICGKIMFGDDNIWIQAFFSNYQGKIKIYMVKANNRESFMSYKLSKEQRNSYKERAINILKERVGEI